MNLKGIDFQISLESKMCEGYRKDGRRRDAEREGAVKWKFPSKAHAHTNSYVNLWIQGL